MLNSCSSQEESPHLGALGRENLCSWLQPSGVESLPHWEQEGKEGAVFIQIPHTLDFLSKFSQFFWNRCFLITCLPFEPFLEPVKKIFLTFHWGCRSVMLCWKLVPGVQFWSSGVSFHFWSVYFAFEISSSFLFFVCYMASVTTPPLGQRWCVKAWTLLCIF